MREAATGAEGGDARRARALAWGFAALLALTFGLIVLGALVRAHEAGLACPDWPLCFGQIVPEMNLQVAFEWSHRAVAGSVALGFAALALGVRRSPALWEAARGPLGVAAPLLGVQILLGALTVWLRLASWTVTAHLIVGNAFCACLLLTALALRDAPGRRAAPLQAGRALRRAVAAVGALLALQMVLGGLVSSSYAGMACPQWPACNGGLWFPSWRGAVGLHLAHRWNPALLLLALGSAVWLARGTRLLAIAALALALGVVQALVGISNVLLGIPVEVTGLHSALAAALVLVVTALARGTFAAGSRSADRGLQVGPVDGALGREGAH